MIIVSVVFVHVHVTASDVVQSLKATFVYTSVSIEPY